jgi:hypothetical protein
MLREKFGYTLRAQMQLQKLKENCWNLIFSIAKYFCEIPTKFSNTLEFQKLSFQLLSSDEKTAPIFPAKGEAITMSEMAILFQWIGDRDAADLISVEQLIVSLNP